MFWVNGDMEILSAILNILELISGGGVPFGINLLILWKNFELSLIWNIVVLLTLIVSKAAQPCFVYFPDLQNVL